MRTNIAVHWFRQDLRLSDNVALTNAGKHGKVLPIYILDDENAGGHSMGEASRWWLYHSLQSLNKSLSDKLSVYKGDPIEIFRAIIAQYGVNSVHWNRCYEPWRIDLDTKIKKFLKSENIEVKTSNGSLLWEPWEIKKNDGSPYKVFTPFYRKGCMLADPPREPLPRPQNIEYISDEHTSINIDKLNLLPKIRWYKQLESHWNIGELSAHEKFHQFIKEGLLHYKNGRNIPAKPYVSRMSPHLHFGEISPNQLWYKVNNIENDKNADHFCSELGWREFSYNQLYYNPDLPKKTCKKSSIISPG